MARPRIAKKKNRPRPVMKEKTGKSGLRKDVEESEEREMCHLCQSNKICREKRGIYGLEKKMSSTSPMRGARFVLIYGKKELGKRAIAGHRGYLIDVLGGGGGASSPRESPLDGS